MASHSPATSTEGSNWIGTVGTCEAEILLSLRNAAQTGSSDAAKPIYRVGDSHKCGSGLDDSYWSGSRATGNDSDIQTGLCVIALVESDPGAGELRVRNPSELVRKFREARRARADSTLETSRRGRRSSGSAECHGCSPRCYSAQECSAADWPPRLGVVFVVVTNVHGESIPFRSLSSTDVIT